MRFPITTNTVRNMGKLEIWKENCPVSFISQQERVFFILIDPLLSRKTSKLQDEGHSDIVS